MSTRPQTQPPFVHHDDVSTSRGTTSPLKGHGNSASTAVPMLHFILIHSLTQKFDSIQLPNSWGDQIFMQGKFLFFSLFFAFFFAQMHMHIVYLTTRAWHIISPIF